MAARAGVLSLLTLGLALASALLACASGTELATAEAVAGEPAPHEQLALPSLAACGGCHLDVWREWSESLHARAWTNANVRRATREFTRERCRSCHSPVSIWEAGLDAEPAYRDFNQADGVHCLSCHGLADGVAAARDVPGAPCRPRRTPELLRAESCWPCHEPTHQAFSEYYTSDAHAVGVRCVDCHMQPLPRGNGSSGRSHGPHGGMNAEFVQRAIAWSATRTDDGVEVRVRNRTGHKFPGEIPSRSFLLRVRFDGGEPLDTLLRKPHKKEDRVDDRLRPDEERSFRFTAPAGAWERARVELWFLPLPLLPPEEGFLLGEWEG